MDYKIDSKIFGRNEGNRKGKIIREIFFVGCYYFKSSISKIIVKPRWLNVGLDHLSRINTGEEPSIIEDGLPNA